MGTCQETVKQAHCKTRQKTLAKLYVMKEEHISELEKFRNHLIELRTELEIKGKSFQNGNLTKKEFESK